MRVLCICGPEGAGRLALLGRWLRRDSTRSSTRLGSRNAKTVAAWKRRSHSIAHEAGSVRLSHLAVEQRCEDPRYHDVNSSEAAQLSLTGPPPAPPPLR